VIYVEELIGPDTVNTMPPATIDAFRDHGDVKRTVDTGVDQAQRDLEALKAAGVSIESVTEKLLVDGVASFQKSFDTLLSGLRTKTKALGKELVETR
jgi:transaldolase